MTAFDLEAPSSYDLARTLASWRMGTYDPSMRIADNSAALALRTPDGAVTVTASRTPEGLRGETSGPGSDWLSEHLASLFGLKDDPDAFEPSGRVVRDLHRRFAGTHLPRAPRVFGQLVAIVLQQLVPWKDACGTWARLTRGLGEDAPGATGLKTPPSADALRSTTEYELVGAGVRHKQARTLKTIGKHATKIETAAAIGPDTLTTLLGQIPGIGPWTSSYLAGSALADPDAVLLADFGLPHAVAYVLAGEPRADDRRMLELLEPYRGHRFRVIRLVWMNGVHAPRRGPRAELP